MNEIGNNCETEKDFAGKDAKNADPKKETDGIDPSTESKDDDVVAALEVPLEPAPPKRILVIDDEPSVRKLLSKILKNADYEVMLAAGGKQGLHLFRENPCDLIITDIVMPDMNGHDLIIGLKKDFPDVKIIAISGHEYVGPEIELFIAESLGAVRIFAKPFRASEILDAVKTVLHQINQKAD